MDGTHILKKKIINTGKLESTKKWMNETLPLNIRYNINGELV